MVKESIALTDYRIGVGHRDASTSNIISSNFLQTLAFLDTSTSSQTIFQKYETVLVISCKIVSNHNSNFHYFNDIL